MIITSEITGKQYKTVDACIEDERKFIAAREAERKKIEEQEQKQNELDGKVEEAFQAVVNACKNYKKALRDAGFKVGPVDEMYLFLEVIEND